MATARKEKDKKNTLHVRARKKANLMSKKERKKEREEKRRERIMYNVSHQKLIVGFNGIQGREEER